MINRATSASRVLLVVCIVWAAGPNSASAQGSFLDKAKEALGNIGGLVPGGSVLSTDEISAGLREALRVGTERVVEQVGSLDGFNADSAIHIALPGPLKDVQSVLQKVGFSHLADDLELRLNRAAEAASSEAKELFWQAINDMTLEDVERIYEGPDDAATQYFQGKMTPPLVKRMTPIVDRSVADVGAIRSYDEMMSQYEAIPFVPDVKADLTNYVVEKAMDGIFHYVAKEEMAIRNNPAKRTTEILRRVFGAG